MKLFTTSLLIIILLVLVFGENNSPHDFTPPFSSMEFLNSYNTQGAAKLTKEWLILTTKKKNVQGSLWGKKNNQISNWEATLEFMIMGGTDKGGNGLAFWYTSDSMKQGDLFGSQNKFTGLGVFLRTNPNDGEGERIQIMIGDGKKEYDQSLDGANVISAECETKLRNKGLVKIRISYSKNELKVLYDLDKNNVWADCAKVSNFNLPTGYHFGFSAETKEEIDNHRIRNFQVKDLDLSTNSETEKKQQQNNNNRNSNNNNNNNIRNSNNNNNNEKNNGNGQKIFGIDINLYQKLQIQYNQLLTHTESLSKKVDKFTEAHAQLYSIEKFLNNLQLFVKQNSHDIFILKRQIDTELTQYISDISKDHHEVDSSIAKFRRNVKELSTELNRSHKKTSGIADSIKDETYKLSEGVKQQGHSLGWLIIIVQMQNIQLTETIHKFMFLTNTTFPEALEIFNKSNCNLKQAIASYVLFTLRTHKNKCPKTSEEKSGKNLHFEMNCVSTRKEQQIKPITFDLLDSEIEDHPKQLSEIELKKILTSKRIVSWVARLNSFQQYNPNLIQNWPNCFQNKNAITINKKLFNLYCQFNPIRSSKNLQRSLVFFFQKKGWSNIAMFDREKMVFIPTEKSYLYKVPKTKKRIKIKKYLKKKDL
ncbi:vesicular mannose-binding lectin [Anaeramoeba flamelloides]|uniref:Vesicular mannose-binding lectin n=1 Tax=Anaeramoeba flamelloides TaxID=1746091 RepID=A0ABQ8YAU4_9EUKA|nr:vesicular mannose-binding lectin [Anaeramoeba flamelloides]